jgi:hypothetical protein
MSFQYQPLNPSEIRLLKPLSRYSDVLSFEIVHLSLLSKPRYAALSYTWGAPGDSQSVLLDGEHFPIRQNLYDALQQIQCSKLVDQYLWVDAMCINQGADDDALSERSVQITLMRQIYEQAHKILIWLGKPADEANNILAFAMMKDFDEQYNRVILNARPYRPWWWRQKARTPGEDMADFIHTLAPATNKNVFDVPGSPAYRAWLGVISLWQSPWWTRTWIFQESTVPEKSTTLFFAGVFIKPFSSKVRFLCGDQETNWPQIDVTYLVALNIISTPGVDSHFLVGTQRSVGNLIIFREQRIQLHVRSFLAILQMFRHTECFDPRDKIYAPLCLAPEDVRRYIKPDYSGKTVLDVYKDVVRYYLTQPGHDLDFLGYAIYQEAQASETPKDANFILPSWIPDFSVSLDIVPIPKILHVPEAPRWKGRTVYDKSSIPNYNGPVITAYLPLRDTLSKTFIEDTILFVSGVFIDIVKDIISSTGPDLGTVNAVAREKGHNWAVDLKYEYFTSESFADAIGRTAVLDLLYDDSGRASERDGKLDDVFLGRPREELSHVEYQRQLNMRSALGNGMALRDMALSQKNYLLMIPNTAVVGDEIWALAGGQVLYILRPMNRDIKQYRFIGECYAHGLMDGEIMRRLSLGEVSMEDINFA